MNGFGTAAACIVADDVCANGQEVDRFELLEQGDGGISIDSVIETVYRLQALQVDGAVDVDPRRPVLVEISRSSPRSTQPPASTGLCRG